MSEEQKIVFFFGKDHSRTFSVSDPAEVLREVETETSKWYRLDDVLMNLDNVTEIYIPKKAKIKNKSF